MSKNKCLYSLDENALWKLTGQGTYCGSQNALARFQKIKEEGGTPKCFLCEQTFSVLNEDDPEQMLQCISLEQKAKPFPG